MAPFCKLHDPSTYQACNWDLTRDVEGREYWTPYFKRHVRTILQLGVDAELNRGVSRTALDQRVSDCCAEFDGRFDAFATSPSRFGRVTIYTLDAWRDEILRKFGFHDAFIDLKHRENEKMLPLLPSVCRALDELSGAAQLKAVIKGVFAGNIFDMGATATALQMMENRLDFFATRDSLPSRPWRVDDYDLLEDRLLHLAHSTAIYFIDNAGSDFLLGAIPMMRCLALRGTRVVIAANERPSLNDMTVHDVRQWWPKILETEASLVDLPISLVSTGTGEPLIDFSAVSDELNDAAANADLVIIEGMGRGVESNLDAAFNCDALNLAMVKDEMIAKRIGGKLYDVVCRFRGPSV